jgi:hypothetical protein
MWRSSKSIMWNTTKNIYGDDFQCPLRDAIRFGLVFQSLRGWLISAVPTGPKNANAKIID